MFHQDSKWFDISIERSINVDLHFSHFSKMGIENHHCKTKVKKTRMSRAEIGFWPLKGQIFNIFQK